MFSAYLKPSLQNIALQYSIIPYFPPFVKYFKSRTLSFILLIVHVFAGSVPSDSSVSFSLSRYGLSLIFHFSREVFHLTLTFPFLWAGADLAFYYPSDWLQHSFHTNFSHFLFTKPLFPHFSYSQFNISTLSIGAQATLNFQFFIFNFQLFQNSASVSI